MNDKLLELIKKHKNKTDFLEIRIENSDTTQIKFFGLDLDNLNISKSNGGYVRACYKGAWGAVEGPRGRSSAGPELGDPEQGRMQPRERSPELQQRG